MELTSRFVFAVLICLMGSSVIAHASTATSKDDFCNMDKTAFLAQFQNDMNRLAFENPAGDLHVGVCWWDSLFQRSSIYLTVFRPDLPKPTAAQAKLLISEIIKKKNVVEIPGYKNMVTFSSDFETEIARQLSDWQLHDAFVDQSWVLDLELGKGKASAEILRAKMDAIYDSFNTSHMVAFVRLKINTVESHALLIADIIPLEAPQSGYLMKVIDSNLSGDTETVTYQSGDQSLALPEDKINAFVPTLGETDDFDAISAAIKSYCSGPIHQAF